MVVESNIKTLAIANIFEIPDSGVCPLLAKREAER